MFARLAGHVLARTTPRRGRHCASVSWRRRRGFPRDIGPLPAVPLPAVAILLRVPLRRARLDFPRPARVAALLRGPLSRQAVARQDHPTTFWAVCHHGKPDFFVAETPLNTDKPEPDRSFATNFTKIFRPFVSIRGQWVTTARISCSTASPRPLPVAPPPQSAPQEHRAVKTNARHKARRERTVERRCGLSLSPPA